MSGEAKSLSRFRKNIKRNWKETTMANIIDDETIEYVGILAKLALSEEEKEQAKKDMSDMLDYIDMLGELDTSNVEPMSHAFPVFNVFREDVVTNGDGSEETLANAPEQKNRGHLRFQRLCNGVLNNYKTFKSLIR